jgi:hypothetical protein
MRIKLLWLVIPVVGALGCDGARAPRQDQARLADQWAVVDAQNAETARQLKIASDQLQQMEEQNARYEVLLAKWEEQADRMDAILDQWERFAQAVDKASGNE